MAYCSPGAEGVLCANRGPLIFAFGSCRGPLGGLKKWKLIQDMVQLVLIQDGLQLIQET